MAPTPAESCESRTKRPTAAFATIPPPRAMSRRGVKGAQGTFRSVAREIPSVMASIPATGTR